MLEVFPLAPVTAAIEDAIERGAIAFDAIKLLTPDRTASATTGFLRLSLPARHRGQDHGGCGLHGPAGRSGRTTSVDKALLTHHLKALKLPTFLREYDKQAQLCTAEGVDHPRYLLRLAELELIEQERWTVVIDPLAKKVDAIHAILECESLPEPGISL